MMEWLGVFMLEVNGLSYRYNNCSWLFEDINLSIRRGEIVGLRGFSGSGKTTMAKIIAGYIKPIEGTILLNGKPHTPNGANPIQLVSQHPEQTINSQWKMKKILTEVGTVDHELLHTLGLRNEWLERFPSELSGGELQRFCIARALGKKTEYLIADEMTTMLDAITQAQIWHAVLRLVKERNIGVLAISHDQQLLKVLSNRIVNFEKLNNKGSFLKHSCF